MRRRQPLDAAVFLSVGALLLVLAVQSPASMDMREVEQPASETALSWEIPEVEQPASELAPSWETLEETAHWAIETSASDTYRYHYAVFDDGGAVLLEDFSPNCPSLSMVGGDVVMASRSYGAPGRLVWFVRLSDGQVRGSYDTPIAWSDTRVAWLDPPDDGFCVLYVQALWQTDAPLTYTLPCSRTVAVPANIVTSAAFSGDTLTLEFLNQDDRLETRVLDLAASAGIS